MTVAALSDSDDDWASLDDDEAAEEAEEDAEEEAAEEVAAEDPDARLVAEEPDPVTPPEMMGAAMVSEGSVRAP